MIDESPGEFLRLPRVEQSTGMKKSFIYLSEKNGTFPKRIRIGRAVVWSSAQVDEWKRARMAGEEWSAS